MNLHVPISEDLVSILDRVLDKSIVMDSWVPINMQGTELWVADAHARVASSAVYVGYGKEGSWQEDKNIKELFPYWLYDPWAR